MADDYNHIADYCYPWGSYANLSACKHRKHDKNAKEMK